jgi:cation diffusion facilitator family transporter
VTLTAVMMVAELIAGSIFGSMALLADGWHMSTHAAALTIAALAYGLARRYAGDERFTFGTGKLGDLAGFASAMILLAVAVVIAYESFVRLFAPVAIVFGEATLVAAIGLIVNLVSAWLLFDHDHHDHRHGEAAHVHRQDANLRAAYLHVLADALTSVLAIAALLAGWLFGWVWLDPVIGLVGAAIIARWSVGLILSAGSVLLDMVPSSTLIEAIRQRLEANGDRIVDIHLWQVGPGHAALIACLVSERPRTADAYKALLADLPGLSHVTIEVNPVRSHGPSSLAA